MTARALAWSRPQLSISPVLAFAALILLVGFGDGVAFRIQEMTGVASPWLILFPLLIGALQLYWAFGGKPLQQQYVMEALLLLTFLTTALMLQVFLHDRVYVAGYLQLTVFVVLLIVVRGVFADAPEWLAGAFPRALLVAHYFLCGYILLALASWHLLGSDPSIPSLMTPAAPDLGLANLTDSSSFRPTGFSIEPAWAAVALAASYTGIHTLLPAERDRAFLALAAAAVALQSPTLILFVSVVAVVSMARGRESIARIGIIVLAALAFAFLAYSARDRLADILTGVDPSALMRLSSASVAWDVIIDSFPLGVGYGNFREFAQYGPEWNKFINLTEAQYYKSDLLFLNYAAELGIWGIVLLFWVWWNFARGAHPLPVVFFLMQLVLSGTLLMPAVVVMAAIVGLLERRNALNQAAEPPRPHHGAPAPLLDGLRPAANGSKA